MNDSVSRKSLIDKIEREIEVIRMLPQNEGAMLLAEVLLAWAKYSKSSESEGTYDAFAANDQMIVEAARKAGMLVHESPVDIREIEEALAAATPGRWHVQPGEHYDAVYSSQSSTLTVVASRVHPNDVYLIANTPKWLCYLIDQLAAERAKSSERIIVAPEAAVSLANALELSEARNEIERLRAALEWYADTENYTYQYHVGDIENEELETAIEVDDGKRAREALKEGEGAKRTIKYALKHRDHEEYLRHEYDKNDAYTDDLGHAAIFDTRELAEKGAFEWDLVVEIECDEDGCLMERSEEGEGI